MRPSAVSALWSLVSGLIPVVWSPGVHFLLNCFLFSEDSWGAVAVTASAPAAIIPTGGVGEVAAKCNLSKTSQLNLCNLQFDLVNCDAAELVGSGSFITGETAAAAAV